MPSKGDLIMAVNSRPLDKIEGRDILLTWKSYLIDTLGYPASQVTQLPKTKFLAVYRDSRHSQCLAILTNRAEIEELLSSGLVEFARRQAAEFVAVGSPSKYNLFQPGPYALVSAPGVNIPSWTPAFSRRELMPKTITLLPFRDEAQLSRAFATCHNAIYTDTAKDPAAAFDLLSLVIAAKVMDEVSEDSHYRFSAITGESEPAAGVRLANLLRRGRHWLSLEDVDQADITDVPTLRPVMVKTIFEQLQDFSLTLTSTSPLGADLLGVAYERMVGSTFRGELGSYFTPRNIADFMVRVLNARSGSIFDPSCGSGGLLIAALRYAKAEDYREVLPKLFGNDLNPRMVEAAKVNFLVHQLDPSHVLRGDGLDLKQMYKRWFDIKLNSENQPLWDLQPGPFDFVLANPPFAGHEKNIDVLQHFATARRVDGTLRSLNKTLPFLEIIVASLKEGGRAGVVLPTSILNAEEESFVRFRELLLTHVELVAIIGLPEKAFVHTDCGVHGALLFFKRCSQPRDNYDIFVGWADEIGYDRLGKPTRSSSFPDLIERFRQNKWASSNCFSLQELRSYQRWDPNWLRVVRNLPDKASRDFVVLGDFLEVRNARWSRKQIQEDKQYHYFEVADADLHTGRVHRVHTATGFELVKKGRIRNQVRSGDILLPNHRDSLMAGGASNGRSVVVVDDTLDGVLTTDRFIVLRSRIEPILMVNLLNSKGVRRQLIARCRGAASLDIRENTLTSVLVPRSLLQEEKVNSVHELSTKVEILRAELNEAIRQLSEMVETPFEQDAPIHPSTVTV